VSDVVGHVRPEFDAFDVFGAAFPAGTVSGAPKIRAIELIAELEGRRRGFYAGSVGRFGFDGSLDACITLRSAHAYDGAYHLQAGAGIVAESASDREDQECLSKAAAVVAAISGADV
jgi:anthranilate synthase component I